MLPTDSFAHLVVLGASAGGIEVLSTLVATLPADFPAPLVIAQHLDPFRPSHLGEILARHTVLPIHSVTAREPLSPGTIYLAPPNCHLLITRGGIEPTEEGPGRSKPSIDLALSSAVAVYREKLIAVILSGTGSDGAAGAHLVKKGGGTVVIQDPSTAAFPGMPLALAPTTVDIVAPSERMGPLLSQLLAGVAVPAQSEEQHTLDAFLLDLRAQSGLDFTQYKKPTILRRLQQRMMATNCEQLADYFAYARAHPEEYRLLVQRFLINVTEFFRDPEVFSALREQVLMNLLPYARSHERALRCWSAGCASGEEAYSLAILVAEALGSELEQFQVRIFATDADPEAIAFARRGIYAVSAFAEVPEDLITHYFTRDEDHYTVKKSLRSLLIFGQHDLSQRAPFPHLDLVLCRNVLIYFAPELQEQALQLFAYSLREGGLLALGKAEAPSSTLARYFQVQHKQARIYRRHGERLTLPTTQGATPLAASLQHFTLPRVAPPGAPASRGAKERPGARTLQEQALHTLPVGVVVVDRHYDIQAINPAARRFFSIHNMALGEDLVHLAGGVPPTLLRRAIDAAFREDVTTTLAEMTIEQVDPTQPHTFQLTVLPQWGEGAPGPVEAAIVLVQEITALVEERQTLQQEVQWTSKELEHLRHDAAEELACVRAQAQSQLEQIQGEADAEKQRREELIRGLVETNRRLLEANQELTSTSEELQTINEELVVNMEEAQASVEEVETLNEELQASNEEMETLNEELQAAVEELHTTNEDLQARSLELRQLAHTSQQERARLAGVLQSMQDAVLVVNEQAQPVLTNQAYAQSFGSHEATVAAQDEEGHPLPPEATPQQRAARGEAFTLEFTLPTAETRRFFEATGGPLQDEEGRLAGGVIVLRDITERSVYRLQDEFIALAGHELRTPLTALNLYLGLLRKQLKDQPAADPLRKDVEQMKIQVRCQERLITDLLDVGRLRCGTFQIQLERLQLEPLVAAMVETAQRLTQQHISLEVTGGPFWLQGDAVRLGQVLLNLLTNAITYAPQSPQIAVRAQRVGQEVELAVQDAGPGIAEANLPQLFSRYYQVKHQGPRTNTGLGLGLYIAKEVVTCHGGQISVASSEGRGTTFTVRLPLVPDYEVPLPGGVEDGVVGLRGTGERNRE
jgi:two-component system, chemotaxis family, CheB/CheR fusion protein